MCTPEHLKLWKLPAYYFGEEWPEYYVFLGRTRDSDNLTNSNFETGLAALGGESETVKVVCESHWAVGWVEWIGVHQSDDTALKLADQMQERLEDYPILDDSDYSNREWEDFTSNCQQAVKDYCNDNSLELTDDQTDALLHELANTMPDRGSESWPDEHMIKDCLPG